MILLDTSLLDELHGPGGLKSALQRAIELEHATIPTYLYSLYSLGNRNPEIAQIILSVIMEEMLHFAIACNIMNAIDGHPKIDKPDFLPQFPGHLPGGVEANLVVHLRRFSKEHVFNTFMVIEEPEHPLNFPTAELAATRLTIGEYYTEISKQIENAGDGIFTGDVKKQATGFGFSSKELFPIHDVETARNAITIIKQQGEGTTTTPEDGEDEFAHYYRFAEIYHGHHLRLVPDPPPDLPPDKRYRYDGPVIPLDEEAVLPVIANPKQSDYPKDTQAHYLNNNFNYAYTSLLKCLHVTFNGHPERLGVAIPLMHSLRELALEMMTTPFKDGENAGPSFEYAPVNPQRPPGP